MMLPTGRSKKGLYFLKEISREGMENTIIYYFNFSTTYLGTIQPGNNAATPVLTHSECYKTFIITLSCLTTQSLGILLTIEFWAGITN